MKKSFIVLTTFISLLATFLSGPMSPANADPLANDASITSLTFGSPNYLDWYGRRDTSGLYPNFSSTSYNYQLATIADILDVNAVLSDPLATMKITFDGVTGDAQSSVAYRISMQPKVSMLDIEVTAQDGVTSKHYKVNVSNQVLQTPEIVSMSAHSGPWAGGMPITYRVKNVILSNGNSGAACYAEAMFTIKDPVTGAKYVTSQYLGNQSNLIPDQGGITTIGTFLQRNWSSQGFTGEAKVSIRNVCYSMLSAAQPWGQWNNLMSESTANETFTYLPLEINDAVIPNTVTGGSLIELKGSSLYELSQMDVYIKDEASGNQVYLDTTPSKTDVNQGSPGSWLGTVDRNDRQSTFSTAGKKLLTAGYWDYNQTTGEQVWVSIFSRVVNWKPTLPSSVVISPAKSDISGGKRVRVEGYDLCNQTVWPNKVEVKIDGKALTNIESQYNNSYCGPATEGNNKPAKQWITGIVPAGTSTGVKTVTVDNGNGPVKVSATFTYGATPDITSIDQTAVASTGGARVRITGHNFGFAGTPTVIIGGKKSPKVTLISDSALDVILPFDLPLGSQAVTVISSSGGGANTTPASINVVAPTQTPTVTGLSVNQGLTSGGDVVTISVSNIGTPSSVGVMFGTNPAEVTRVTASQIDVKVPAGAAGATSLTVSSALGQIVVADAFTYNAIAGVKSVSPSTVASTADQAGRIVTITGVGFGPGGVIKIGQGPAFPYASTEAGTKISNILIPNDVAGSVAILITPNGSLVPLATSVTVTRPKMTYVGTSTEDQKYNFCALNDWNCLYGYNGGTRPTFGKLGGEVLKIKGTGFGTSGTVKLGTQTINPTAYSDSEILVTLPALSIGEYDLTVVPSSGFQTATRSAAFSIVEATARPAVEITGVAPTIANSRGDAIYNFDPSLDASSVFAITGRGFLGDDNGASTKVSQLEQWQDPRYSSSGKTKVKILSITDTRITFSALRSYVPIRWVGVVVETSQDLTFMWNAIHYVGNPPPIANISSWWGLCTKDAIKSHSPAVVTVTGTGMFGTTGSVTLSDQPIDPAAVTWSTDSVSVDFSKLPADLAEHWGQKKLEFVPADNTLMSRTFDFFCGVWAEVETKINGSTGDLNISAGDTLTATANVPADKRLNEVVPNDAWPTDGYQYQSAADHARSNPWTYNVGSGLPTYAGDWYIRANPGTTTTLIDRGIYAGVSSSEVHVMINGTAIAFTPKLKDSADTTITYKGQLGDGTNDSSEDLAYTVNLPAGTPAITKTVWEFRNHACGVLNNEWGWYEGLPSNVAVIPNDCGGDGVAISSWDIRVRSFEMMKDGKDQAMFYLPTFNTFNLMIAKRALTIDKVNATKPFDGNANIYLGALTVTGAIEGETPTLQGNDSRNGYFADATVGENKPVYVAGSDGQLDFIQRIKLEGSYDWNYYLTNSELLVLGAITKANARLSMSATHLSLVMSVVEQSTISTSVIDTVTNNAPIGEAGVSDVVVQVTTPSVCSISAELVVTALAPGDCIVQASQGASTNYNAATALSDPESNVETLTITVFAEPKKVSVITQDLIVGQGEAVSPSFEVLGLADGDSLDTVVWEYYDGATKLDSVPTEPGRYTLVGSSANIVSTNLAAYNSNIEFVAGTLVITSPPPTITGMTPTAGSQAGGENIVITGTNLSAVSRITFGDVVISNNNFVVNGDGTEISFVAPAGSGNVSVVLTAGDSQLSLSYSYDPTVANVSGVAPNTGAQAGGNTVVVTGTHLELVTEVRFGSVTIPSANLTRSEDGTTISFAAPAGTGKVNILLVTESGNSSFEYNYASTPPAVATLITVAPPTGYERGGNVVVVTGTHLELVTEVRFGSVTIPSANLTLSEDGTTISFVVPAGTGKATVVLAASSGDLPFDYTYKGPANPGLLLQLMNPEFGKSLSGQMIKMTATDLKPGATYSLNMYSKKVAMVTGTVSPDGSINGSMLIPAKACVKPGMHKLILESEDESGKKYHSTVYVVLGANCALNAVAQKVADGSWSVKAIRFDYKKWDLKAEARATLAALKTWLKGAASIKVSGYTETDGKGLALKLSNRVLAKNRALAVVRLLKSLGLTTDLAVNPVGAKYPVSKIQAKNRRVELKVRF